MVWWGREGIVTNTRGGADSTTIYNRYAPLITLKLNNARGGGGGGGRLCRALPFSLASITIYNLQSPHLARGINANGKTNVPSQAAAANPLCVQCAVSFGWFWFLRSGV